MDIEVFVGMIKAFPYASKVPMGWALCNGQTVSVSQNQALYALIGNKFGGDTNNFALPKLIDASINAAPLSGMKYYIALVGIFPTQS